jgi:type II secretory ATPase GspE/PulE/Tfp pilus assembly ATPase PilB-like protein
MNLPLHNFVFQPMGSIVGLVDEMLDRASKTGVSDIHIDPRSDDVRIRFRIDGILYDVCTISRTVHGEFVARIKIISGLRVDERIMPQDGRLTVGDDLDVRVTTIASYYGESVVLRLLRRTAKVQTLSELGFSSDNQEKIHQALKSRQGLILVTGPTGSGKTTTLYSLLSMIDNPSVSTVTIEDPVEYSMTHARQIQVQQKRGINFVNGLRSILRQDPDVIMVGEIRDHETAALATSAALTGHLVFSTLHTNDAISTITRCIEMGIEPYLIAATLRLVVSQRLVRKLCFKCRRAGQMNEAERAVIEKDSVLNAKENSPPLVPSPVYSAQGCEKCGGTGYSGRTVVAEILPATEKLRQMIVERQPIRANALEMMETISDQAKTKYLQGIISFDEMAKILHE